MFIRATKTHSVGGQPGYSCRLVQSVRCGAAVQQKTLLNLGTDYAVPRALWADVAAHAERLLRGQSALFEVAHEVRLAAEDLVRRLRARGFASEQPAAEQPVSVQLHTLAHCDARSVGGERLALRALQQLRLPALLREAGASQRDAAIATALVMARMLHPSSEREAQRWLRDHSSTLELLGLDTSGGVSLAKLYRIGDLLWKHREALQAGLFARERDLLGLPRTIVFYDLSNTHYTGRENAGLRRFGKSKQKRNDCPLVSLAMALDGSGFPRRCEILAGNVSEPGTLQPLLERLDDERQEGAPRPTVVFDAGLASAANLSWLREQGWHWICVSREAKPQPPAGEPTAQLETSGGYCVRAWPLPAETAQAAAQEAGQEPAELRVYALSEGRLRTAESILQRQRERFEQALQSLHEGLSKPRCVKQLAAVQRKVGRLLEQYKAVAAQYKVEVLAGEQERATAVRCTPNPQYAAADAAAGAYVLRTSQVDWDVAQVLRSYWELSEVEATFRSLQSELGLRPIWHRLDRRVAAHLFVAVLAYHGVHLLRTQLRAHGLHWSWQSLRERLAGWMRVTTSVQAADGQLLCSRQDVQPGAEAVRIAQAAGLAVRAHRRRAAARG